VKEYEYIQIQTYLYLTGLNEAKLVEQYNTDTYTLPITKDSKYYENIILPELNSFIHRLHELLLDPLAQREYLLSKSKSNSMEDQAQQA
jgi:hypothetical protein